MKAPKLRIMYGDPVAFDNEGNPFAFKPVLYAKRSKLHSRTFAVIPCPTAAKARKIVKAAPFLTMTEEEQVEALRKMLARNWTGSCEEDARLVLAAINGGAR